MSAYLLIQFVFITGGGWGEYCADYLLKRLRQTT